jgi:hypothetical protein
MFLNIIEYCGIILHLYKYCDALNILKIIILSKAGLRRRGTDLGAVTSV